MGGHAQEDPYRASSQMTKPKTTEVRCDRKPGHGSSAGALPRPLALPACCASVLVLHSFFTRALLCFTQFGFVYSCFNLMRAAGLHVSNKKGGEGKGNWGALGDAAVAPLGELEPLPQNP